MQALSVFSLSLPASSRVLLCPSLYPYPLERDGYGQRCQSFCIPLSVCLHRSVYLYLSGPVSFIWLVSTMRFRELFASSSIPESIFSFPFFLIRRRIRRGLGCILQGHSSGEMLGVRWKVNRRWDRGVCLRLGAMKLSTCLQRGRWIFRLDLPL